MALFNVDASAMADSKAEALRLAKDHVFTVFNEEFNRWHPDTEFDIVLDDGELACVLTDCGEPFHAVYGGQALCVSHFDQVAR